MNIPWIEKYRPKTIDEMLGNEHIKKIIKGFIEKGDMPHLLFSGPPSTGKTTTALILARAFYGDDIAGNFLELNASDERGIDVIRERVKEFARTLPNNKVGFKIIFLDEADALTIDAQQALRRMMEIYSKYTRFILSCNYINKIIAPIQSRTAIIRFTPIADDYIIELINRIAQNEGFTIEPGAKQLLLDIGNGDLRKIITILQSSYYSAKGIITEKIIKELSGAVTNSDANQLLTLIQNSKLKEAREMIISMLNNGEDPDEIVLALVRVIERSNLEDKLKLSMIKKIAEYHYRIAIGANPDIQLLAMIMELSVHE